MAKHVTSGSPKWILIGTGVLSLIAAGLALVARYYEIQKAAAEAHNAHVATERARTDIKSSANQYPALDGCWEEGEGILITIVQDGQNFTADCAFHHPDHGDICWQMTGTVSKRGEITGRLLHTKAPATWGHQVRVGMLSTDGKTITGRARFDGGGGHDFVWHRLVKNQSR